MKWTFILIVAMLATLVWAIDIATPLSAVTRAYHTGNLADAERVAKIHITFDSKSADSRFVSAKIYAELGKFAEAMALLRENIKESPTDFRSWALIGACHVRLGDEAEGIKCLKKALELNPYHGSSILCLAKTTTDKRKQTELLERVLVMEDRGSAIASEALEMLDASKKK